MQGTPPSIAVLKTVCSAGRFISLSASAATRVSVWSSLSRLQWLSGPLGYRGSCSETYSVRRTPMSGLPSSTHDSLAWHLNIHRNKVRVYDAETESTWRYLLIIRICFRLFFNSLSNDTYSNENKQRHPEFSVRINELKFLVMLVELRL